MSASDVARVAARSGKAQLGMVALGYLPLLHVALAVGAVVVGTIESGIAIGVGVGLSILYLLPAIVARVLLRGWKQWPSPLRVGDRGFLRWWASLQLQIVFLRLPFLEELIRLVPGLYSAWLRLWGSRIGRFVYWSPAVRITDRSLLEIGDRTVIGGGAHLSPHLVAEHDGELYTLVAPVKVGAECLVGGLSMLPPSTTIPDGVMTPGHRVLIQYVTDRKPWERLDSRGGKAS